MTDVVTAAILLVPPAAVVCSPARLGLEPIAKGLTMGKADRRASTPSARAPSFSDARRFPRFRSMRTCTDRSRRSAGIGVSSASLASHAACHPRRASADDSGPAPRPAARAGPSLLVDACARHRDRRHRDLARHDHHRAAACVGAARCRSLLQPGARRLLRRLAVLSRRGRLHRAIRHRRRSGDRPNLEPAEGAPRLGARA